MSSDHEDPVERGICLEEDYKPPAETFRTRVPHCVEVIAQVPLVYRVRSSASGQGSRRHTCLPMNKLSLNDGFLCIAIAHRIRCPTVTARKHSAYTKTNRGRMAWRGPKRPPESVGPSTIPVDWLGRIKAAVWANQTHTGPRSTRFAARQEGPPPPRVNQGVLAGEGAAGEDRPRLPSSRPYP